MMLSPLKPDLKTDRTVNFNIKGFISTSLVDWPGKISSVIFLGGCGFRCRACHNAQLVLHPDSLDDYPLDEILAYVRQRSQWIDGVTVTGGEPTLQRSLPLLLARLKETGLRVKLDTNGSDPSAIARLARSRLVDAVFMDVKAPLDPVSYTLVAGVPVNPAVIRRSIHILKDSGLEVVFRTTVVPGLVEEPELERIREALGKVDTFIVQPFRSSETLDPKLRNADEFTLDRVEAMKARFEIPSRADLALDRYWRTG